MFSTKRGKIQNLIRLPKHISCEALIDSELKEVPIVVGELDKLREYLDEEPGEVDVDQQFTQCCQYSRTAVKDCLKVLESKKSNVQPRLATATDVRRRTLDDASIAAPVGAAAASSSSSSLDNSLPASILDPQTAKIMQLNGIEEANWTPFIAPTSSRRVAVHSMADA